MQTRARVMRRQRGAQCLFQAPAGYAENLGYAERDGEPLLKRGEYDERCLVRDPARKPNPVQHAVITYVQPVSQRRAEAASLSAKRKEVKTRTKTACRR